MNEFFVRRYLAEGRITLPVIPGEKATRFKNWSTLDVRASASDFAPDDNIAERLDAIVDVDCDTPEARAIAPKLLLETGRTHARPSLGVTHHWFISPGCKAEQFK